MTIIRLFSLLFFSFFAFTPLIGQSVYQLKKPETRDDGWQTAFVGDVIQDTVPLFKVMEQLARGESQLHSVLLLQNNTLVFEEYYGNYKLDEPHDLRSTTKSIRSLLLGIAIEKGFVKSVDDPIYDYLPELRPQKNMDPRKSQITIRHLLTMSTGLECNDWDPKSRGHEDRVYKKKDWLQYTMDLPQVNDPGTVSVYCSMGAILVAEIISQSSGMSIQEFAQIFLFDPLEIRNIHWEHTDQGEVLDSGKRLYMTPRDLAKIGQLVLQEGQWEGEPLISASWIREATSPKTKITGIDYGYLWWNFPFKVGETTLYGKLATGNGGQYIMVFPTLEVVMVFTGGAYNSQEDKLPFVLVNRVFLPAFLNKKPGVKN
jgi:CubicO group peptidase (beta-lactamase class C family)